MQGFWTGFEKSAMKQVSTVGIIAIDGKKILMGKRKDNQKWTTPGGHLDKGEKPIKGAIRETWEESGIDLDEDDLIHVKSITVKKPDGEKLKVHAFKAFLGSDELTKPTTENDPDDEVYSWKWVKMKPHLPKDILDNLHVPLGRNVLLDNLGIKPLAGEAKTAFWAGFTKEVV
jgi:8-oxo-dGTP pyrophosphatase MutT (NUDIX family)